MSRENLRWYLTGALVFFAGQTIAQKWLKARAEPKDDS
jgi:hypothetical protein